MRLFCSLTSCLILSVVVLFKCSPASASFHSSTLLIKLPLIVFLCSSESNAGKVWVPDDEPAKDSDGTVLDEFAEVAHVFAKPEAQVVKNEEIVSEQAQPWTSLKQEWDLYKKYHQKKESAESSEDSEEDEEAQDELPQAFYGQQNADDDEQDHFQNEKKIFKRTKKVVKPVEDESEEDDIPSGPIPNLDELPESVKDALLEKLLASTQPGGQGPPGPPQGSDEEDDRGPPPQGSYEQDDRGPPPQGSYEQDDLGPPGPPPRGSDEEDEDEEEEDDTPEADLEQDDLPSPPKRKRNKGDDGDLQDDEGGDGKKGKGKGKKKKNKGKGKKGGNGWGWKPRVTYIPIKPPGWGWKPKDHDGLLEQMVKGSTWERVLRYYHSSKDEREKNKPGPGWKKADLGTKLHLTGEGLAQKLFKGSFWERAFNTYAHYKNNNKGKPSKEYHVSKSPISIDW